MNKKYKSYRVISILCFLGCLSLSSVLQAQLPEPTRQHQQIQAGKTPEGLTTNAWKSIQQQVNLAKYQAYEDNKGGYRSANPAQGWQIQYAEDGTTTLTPRNNQAKPYHLDMKLSAIGYQSLQPLHSPQKISQQDYTVSYQWNEFLRERWINSEQQLEQWFDIEHRPEGADKGLPLTVQMTLNSELKTIQNGNSLVFSNSEGIRITYNKLKVWDSTGQEIPASMKLAGNTLNLLVNDSTAQYPLTIDPSFQQQAYLKASNTDTSDTFGYSIAISGDTIVVGAPDESSASTGVNGDQTDNSCKDCGAAYVFLRKGDTWTQQAYLKASNTDFDDEFGGSVAISGDTLVVGARYEDSSSTGVNSESDKSEEESGAAYVFKRTGTTWVQQAYLKASNTDADDQFGRSVAISGDTILVGALEESSSSTGVNGDQTDNTSFAAGAAYVFTRSDSMWSQQAYLKASNTEAGDYFGESVAISGDTLVVGADEEDSNSAGVNGDQSNNSGTFAGAAYVFIRSGETWSQQAYLKASNTDSFGRFGWSLAISGDTLVVGTRSEAAFVFFRTDTTWAQQAYLRASNMDGDDQFGRSVAISGNMLVVGSLFEDSNSTRVNGDESDNSSWNSGAAYVFTRTGSMWSQQSYLKASNAGPADVFGHSVAISGSSIVVGAAGDDSSSTGVNGDQNDNLAVNSGAAYVFTLSSIETLWIPIAIGPDDAEENLNDGDISLFSSDLELTQDGLKPQLVGLRFPLNIPAGATVLTASIQFTADETSSTLTDLLVSAEATTDALPFRDLKFDISNRPLTAASIPWTPLEWTLKGEAGPDQQTPDLSLIVQEIVDQNDWVQGNAMAIIISGDGMREAESFDGTASPILQVTYSIKTEKVEPLWAPIKTSSDDAEENLNDGDVSLFSSDLELIQDGLKPQLVGLRFPLDIPAGATVLNASIQFTADEKSSTSTVLLVSAEAITDALPFRDLKFDISNRPLTAASIPWTPPEWTLKGEAGPGQQTPDLSPILQEIVDQDDWGQGNAMAIIISGDGMREAESFDGTASPVLHVNYSIETDNQDSYAIGDTGPAGGIVFHVTDGGLHGLEAAPVNQSTVSQWGCHGTDIPAIENLSNLINIDNNSGAANTVAINNQDPACTSSNGEPTAAQVAADYRGPGNNTSGWFLPNREELDLLFAQKDIVGGFANGTYLSSSEYDSLLVWNQGFLDGIQGIGSKFITLRVRAVRAF